MAADENDSEELATSKTNRHPLTGYLYHHLHDVIKKPKLNGRKKQTVEIMLKLNDKIKSEKMWTNA